MSKFIHTVRQIIAQIMGQSPSSKDQKTLIAEKILAALNMTREHELSCDEVFDVVDKYAEAVVQRKDVSALMPLVHHHLQMCQACREELEMLLEMINLEAA